MQAQRCHCRIQSDFGENRELAMHSVVISEAAAGQDLTRVVMGSVKPLLGRVLNTAA